MTDVLAILVVVYWIGQAWDRRGGLNIHTDQDTGLQYLAHPFGGLTPRLDADGCHMREPPKVKP